MLSLTGATHADRLRELLAELGRRRMTNVLVEGGGMLLGALADLGQIDELHVFIAPRVMGGAEAPSPIGGQGIAPVCESFLIDAPQWRDSGGDLYLSGRVSRQRNSSG